MKRTSVKTKAVKKPKVNVEAVCRKLSREQKISAYTMKVDGATYEAIAESLGLSEEEARAAMRELIKPGKKTPECIFPAVPQAMQKKGIKSYKELAEKSGTKYNTLILGLKRGSISMKTAASLSKTLSIPIESFVKDQ